MVDNIKPGDKGTKERKRLHANHFSDAEIEYIRNNSLVMTDESIAEKLGRNIKTVKRWRKMLGIDKTKVKKVKPNEDGKIVATTAISANPYVMAEEQREKFFQAQLENSKYYSVLKSQFSEDEIKFYLEEFGALCRQFEDVVATESRQIDEYIKAEIMGNRILRNIKMTEDQIQLLQKDIEDLRESGDIAQDEKLQRLDDMLMTLLRHAYAQAAGMATEYKKNFDSRREILNDLDGRRKDRVDKIEKSGTTLIGLIEKLKDRQERHILGRHIELMNLARKHKEKEWRKVQVFKDGSKQPLLLDDVSVNSIDVDAFEEIQEAIVESEVIQEKEDYTDGENG